PIMRDRSLSGGRSVWNLRPGRPGRPAALVAVVAAVLAGLTGYALSESAPVPGASSAGSGTAHAATTTAAAGEGALLQSAQILQFLDRTVAWYHSRTAQ